MSVIFNAYSDVRDTFPDPVSVTWVKGVKIDRVVEGFGGESVEILETTWEKAGDGAREGGGGIFLVASEGDWTVIIEPTGCQGSDSGLLARLSGDGEALNLFWTINHLAYLSYAAGGREVASFEPLDPESAGDSPEALAWLNGLSVTSEQWQEDWKAASFAVAEELSGIHLDRAWLGRQRWSVVTRPGVSWEGDVDEDEEDGEIAPSPFKQGDHGLFLREDMLRFLASDFTIACIAADPVPEKFQGIIVLASLEALGKAGIDDTRAREALMAVAEGRRGKRGRRNELVQQFREEFGSMAAEYREKALELAASENAPVSLTPGTESGRLMITYQAVRTLLAALNTDYEQAVQEVMAEAKELSSALGNEKYTLMTETLDAIQRFIRTGETGL